MTMYDEAVRALATDHGATITRSLTGRFPKMPADRVEECVQDVLLEALDPERNTWFVDGLTRGGADELRRRVYTAGWRRVRGELRKVGHQRTDRMPTHHDAADDGADTADRAQAGAALSWLDHQADEAAARFGRRRERTLRKALGSLFRAGHDVKPLAERYDLPRRYLAEASVWIKRRLRDRAEEP